MPALVLDAGALSALVSRRGGDLQRARALLAVAHERAYSVVVPAPVLAELYRGSAADAGIDSALNRTGARVVDMNRRLARVVGQLLGRDRLDSCHVVDASVVATAVRLGGALIATSDPDDIEALARHHPNVKVRSLNRP